MTVARDIVPAWSGAPAGPGAGPRFVLRREWFGSLVYDRETLQYVPYDPEATGLILGGERDPSSARERAFLAALAAEELLDADGRLTARVVADRSHPDRISAPLTVYLGATQGCNLACSHCQAGSGPGPLRPLGVELAGRLFREMFELGCGLVHVTGGEPLLHPEFFPAIDQAFERGLNVLLTTNGTVVTEPLADALAERPFRCVSVSLDGPDPASNDLVRGTGAFQAALRGLSILARRRPVGVTATFTPALVGRLPELARRVEDAGAASLTLRPALPSGRALARPDTLPSHGDFLAAIAELDRLQEEAAIPLFHPPPVPHQHTSAWILERFGCVAGNLVCSVSSEGQVNPCALLGPGFDAGSLADRSLAELWAEGEPFRRLRAQEGNPLCWSCKHYDHCGGGCRARALAAGGDLSSPDPWCSWAPLVES